ncbi:hypothetical protein AG1IA_10197 [Rhizoctonia solani AG-1 IA]|uniref:Uncharacterized protein n=1 Tax=Thanatephorus cucumeris (strain AG1-IA) TaxID=983506 RepID=L8WG95_THACA|nr:hypothetical protein AG1IA_10197 [Rhizoctonia solani AG-1 IA]
MDCKPQIQGKKQAAQKWSTLVVEIDKRWKSPKPNFEAYLTRCYEEWQAHTMDLAAMTPELTNAATSGQNPLEEWAMQHKSLALDCDGESGRARVYNLTQHVLPPFIVDMLPKSSYGSDFDGLINDIAALNPRSVQPLPLRAPIHPPPGTLSPYK